MEESDNEMEELMKKFNEIERIDFDEIEKRLYNALHPQPKESRFMTRAEVKKISWDNFEERMEAEFEFAENVKREIIRERIEETKMVDKMTEDEKLEYYSKKCDNVQKIIEEKNLNYVKLEIKD